MARIRIDRCGDPAHIFLVGPVLNEIDLVEGITDEITSGLVKYVIAFFRYWLLMTSGFILGVFIIILAAALSASRLYFLVEAIISLRQPESRLYETVRWTQFWPHG